jgi:4a-hydroxytetrahydrobiopterin dehydratase
MNISWPTVDEHLHHTFTFSSYLAGVAFASKVADIAEDMDHHPDILIQWRKVTLSIRTHSKQAITALDYTFQDRCNSLYAS